MEMWPGWHVPHQKIENQLLFMFQLLSSQMHVIIIYITMKCLFKGAFKIVCK